MRPLIGILESLGEAAKDIGEVSEEEIFRTVYSYRRKQCTPEITFVTERYRPKVACIRRHQHARWSVYRAFGELYAPIRNRALVRLRLPAREGSLIEFLQFPYDFFASPPISFSPLVLVPGVRQITDELGEGVAETMITFIVLVALGFHGLHAGSVSVRSEAPTMGVFGKRPAGFQTRNQRTLRKGKSYEEAADSLDTVGSLCHLCNTEFDTMPRTRYKLNC